MTALQIPQHVVLNETVRMQCNFNLDKEVLYSVKWYKDGHEFYRYLPRDVPSVQTFRVAGVNVNVGGSSVDARREIAVTIWKRGSVFQIQNSTERAVVLNNVNLTSSGRYRCEVSAEAPAFQTVSDHADMTVVGERFINVSTFIDDFDSMNKKPYISFSVLPDEGPRITGGRSRYKVGEVVRMNCTSAPSKPAALLTWFINGDPVSNRQPNPEAFSNSIPRSL